jgi:hypothetical protein
MKIGALYVFPALLVFNLILPLTSASTTYYYSTPIKSIVLSPDIVFDEGTNGTAYIISTSKTWAEVNVNGNLTETYYEYILNITNLSSSINYTAKLESVSVTGIDRLTNFTAYFHDGTPITSKQIEISNGSVAQPSGPGYSITTSATIYTSLAIHVNATGTSIVSLRLHIVTSGATSPEIIQTIKVNVN